MRIKNYILFLFLLISSVPAFAQPNIVGGDSEIDYRSPKEYIIENVTVTGAVHFNDQAIILIAELERGKKIRVPGDDIAKAIKKLWDQGLFSEISIDATQIRGDKIFLDIKVKERPRLANFKPIGFRKKEFEDIYEKIEQYKGRIVTDNMMTNINNTVRAYYIDKGFKRVKVDVRQAVDTVSNNTALLIIEVKKGNKVKIGNITVEGNTLFSDRKILGILKDTKKRAFWRFWKQSKYLESNLNDEKAKIIAAYNDKGYRDAEVIIDSVYDIDADNIGIAMRIVEGKKYYFRNITWVGNSLYSSQRLDTILDIKKGTVYNQGMLEERLFMSANGTDITSIYMDRGYLFFSITPVEVHVENDSIDIEMRIVEGKQARVRNIIIKGNTKTNDHVIRREIRTRPGDLFSRNDIIRTQRELSNLGYFDPEKFGVNPMPNPADGTVDIEYTVEERPSDQVELSGGWGAGRFIGTLGLSFNNFSIKNIFNLKSYTPLPSGDGQSLTIRAQSTGFYYQAYNMSFTEPWLGGKKPNSLTVSVYHTMSSRDTKKRDDPEKSKFSITGASIGFGKRLKWPDDFFSIYVEAPAYAYYTLQNYQGVFTYSDGYVNSFSARINITRNSVDQPLFPRRGSTITFSGKFTPPYSWFNDKDYSNIDDAEKYKWLEYNKWKFTTSFFAKVAGSEQHPLVLNVRTGFGFLFPWSKAVGDSPFERFKLGGSGLSGINYIFGQEIIALRGYDDGSVSQSVGDMFIAKYTAELRFLLSPNPNATVYMLGFAEAGNTWSRISDFNPFQVKRAAGVGVRIFLPMFGLLGLDYGWGFDALENSPGFVPKTGQFFFTIGMNLGEL
jgi:outer membrane protein insertion porin family